MENISANGEPSTHDDDVARFNEGMALIKEGRVDEAIEKLREAATTGKDRPLEHYALAAALYRLKNFDEALKEFHYFLAVAPGEDKYTQQARAAMDVIGKMREKKEEEPAPDVPTLYENIAYDQALNAYLRGDYQEAADGFLETLDDLPGNKFVHNNLGLTYLAMGQCERAIGQFECALETDPDFPEALNNLGLAWSEQGFRKARSAFETALEGDPNYFDALANLGSLFYRRGDRDRARQLWERAHEINPEDPQVRRNLGI